MLVDEILAALYPTNPPLVQFLDSMRLQFSDEEIRSALPPAQDPTPTTAVVCLPNNEGGDKGITASDTVAAHGSDIDVI